MSAAFVYDAVRTPRGKGRDGGSLNQVTPLELQKQLINALLRRNELDADTIDDLVLGCVTQVGEQGGNIAKVAALYSGLPDSVPGITVNRYCTSALDACNFAAMKVTAGGDRIVLAGGVESMSRVAMLSDHASFYTDADVIQRTGFVPMGLAADLVASLDGISRSECDDYAVQSQRRAAAAQQNGHFDESLVPVTIPASDTLVTHDECVRADTTVEKLAAFDPLFAELGQRGYEDAFKAAFVELDALEYVHHIGNSPGIVDGASLVLVGSEQAQPVLGKKPRARIRAMTSVSADRYLALTGGIDATRDVLKKAGMTESDIDLVEFNEAFAAVVLRFLRECGWQQDQVNVNGGAIALGHAMGATGASLLGTLLDELERRDLQTGLVALSGAAGIGTAAIIERV